jgi:hypothetical protein
VQASLDQKQRLQQLFYPDDVVFDGIRFNRTAATAPLFKYLEPAKGDEESLVGAGGIVPAGGRASVRRAPEFSRARPSRNEVEVWWP